MIKAPFNFVPLAECPKAFIPKWWNDISHDVPFEDGVSGCIEFQIISESPIFVRNGNRRDINDSSFSNIDNKYFIPGTSLKGTIREVLEIMSFSKMTRVENNSFGLREVGITPTAKEYMKKMKKVHCGWLTYDGEQAKLQDCGEPLRESIGKHDTDIDKFIQDSNNFKNGNGRSALLKYKRIFCKTENIKESDKYFNEKFIDSNSYLKRIERGDCKGTLVVTGQPGARYYDPNAKNPGKSKKAKRNVFGVWKGKGKEFIFPDSDTAPIDVPNDVFDAFRTIHRNSEDFKDFWSIKLNRGQRIPVFFQYGSDGRTIHSIGLSYLYRYPYKNSVYDAIPDGFKDSADKEKFEADMSECIFGYSIGANVSLKGRVMFSHSWALGNPTVESPKKFVSSSPHPSFYPLYVKDGLDWNNASIIQGYKRYPIRDKVYYKNEGTEKMGTEISLLKDARFKGKISFFNLRPAELGALLSALTYHNNTTKCFHNIGWGKPYGYGKVRIANIELISCDNVKLEILPYMRTFENVMENYMQEQNAETKWIESPQMIELLSMAKGITAADNERFSYLHMDNNPKKNEFKHAKDDQEYLPLFTKLANKFSFISTQDNNTTQTDARAEVKQSNTSVSLTPTTHKIGEKVNAYCCADKKIRIAGEEYDIQLVVPKFKDSKSLVGHNIQIVIKQISKVGKIIQASIDL